MIPQAPWQKAGHESTHLEADADPFSLCRTIHFGCCRLWSSQSQKALSSQSRNRHLEIVRRNGEKPVRTLTVATPDSFDERMV
jgi:hypothetical protein